MTNPFDQPPQAPPPQEPERDKKRNRTSLYGFDWSSPSRYRMAAGIIIAVLSAIPFGIYGSENGSDHPALLVVAVPLVVVGLIMVVWPAK